MITPTFCFEEELDEFESIEEALPTFKLGFPAYLSKQNNLTNKLTRKRLFKVYIWINGSN